MPACVAVGVDAPNLTPPCPPATHAAGMDNQITIWGLQPYAHVVAASEKWVPGGPRVFPTSHVTMPLFSSEVGWGRTKDAATAEAAVHADGCAR